MEVTEFTYIYLALIRFITLLFFVNIYLNNKTKTNLILVISITIYSLAAVFLIFVNYNIYFGALAGIFAIIGVGFIIASVLNFVYKISFKILFFIGGIISVLIVVVNMFSTDIASILIYLFQALILIIGLIASFIKIREFNVILGSSKYCYYGTLITGNLVIGISIINVLIGFKLSMYTQILTFLTSLLLAFFFIQLDGINKSRLIKQSNEDLKNEIINKEKIKQKQEAMIANISDVISIINNKGMISYISPNIEKWFGWTQEEMIGRNSFELINPESFEFTIEDLAKFMRVPNLTNTIEVEYRCKDRSFKDVELTVINLIDDSNINGILLNYHDISERKKLEKDKLITDAYMTNQQKLESIGTLAGGVAHEINNPINGIMNYTQLIIDESKFNADTLQYLNEITFESKRISEIVKNLLHFSRHDKQEHSLARIVDIIERTLMLIKTIIKQDQIILEVDIPKELPNIKCRSQQIQQVLMNLLTNARDTLNEKYPNYNENKICKLYCKKYNKDNKEWIRVTVEDHGNGINKDILDKIFVPFFTTKDREHGTGLGLSISYGIVKDHHGDLTVDTKIGEYTKFNLDLPVDNGWDIDI